MRLVQYYTKFEDYISINDLGSIKDKCDILFKVYPIAIKLKLYVSWHLPNVHTKVRIDI